MTFYASQLKQPVPQSQPVLGREAEMQPNAAGGYAFSASDFAIFKRFLILGTEGGTFYTDERKLTLQALPVVQRVIRTDGPTAVVEIVRVSEAGLALKQSPVIFALAFASTLPDAATRAAVYDALPRVCRTASHLFEFLETAKVLGRTSSAGLRRAIGCWYTERRAHDLELQLVKYRQRNRWTHRDALRVAHLRPQSREQEAALRWTLGKLQSEDVAYIPFIAAYEHARQAATAHEVAELIVANRLPREAVDTKWLNDRDVWAALLQDMPMTALVRNLGKLTAVGLVAPFADATAKVVEKLSDATAIRKSRLHPLAALRALKQYQAGHGDKGSLKWEPNARVIDALDTAFTLSFENVAPIEQNVLVAVDSSGSMSGWGGVAGVENLTPIEAAAALAMVYLRAQPKAYFMAFDTDYREVAITPQMRLVDVVTTLSRYRGGGTDCAFPFRMARERNWPVDAVLMVTDGESWVGNRHAFVELSALRAHLGKPVRTVLVQTTSSETTLLDPRDALAMELPGFGPDIPQVTNLFFAGEL